MAKQAKEKKEFTAKTKIKEVLKDEKFKTILTQNNFPCMTCPFAEAEMNSMDLQTVARTYNLDLAKLLAELNAAA